MSDRVLEWRPEWSDGCSILPFLPMGGFVRGFPIGHWRR